MTVLVDDIVRYPPARTAHLPGRDWCHMVSDESFDELHAMAEVLGIPRWAFHRDHYDLTPPFRERAIELGAEAVPGTELARRRVRINERPTRS